MHKRRKRIPPPHPSKQFTFFLTPHLELSDDGYIVSQFGDVFVAHLKQGLTPRQAEEHQRFRALIDEGLSGGTSSSKYAAVRPYGSVMFSQLKERAVKVPSNLENEMTFLVDPSDTSKVKGFYHMKQYRPEFLKTMLVEDDKLEYTEKLKARIADTYDAAE